MRPLLFSTIEVSKQAFWRTTQAAAIVNLKPIVPGHVLVFPTRPVSRLSDLSSNEISSLFTSVHSIGKVIEKAYNADGLTIACQDGKAAGQTIPHVHIHVLPRRFKGDPFANNDDVYPAIESHEAQLGKQVRKVERKQTKEASITAVKSGDGETVISGAIEDVEIVTSPDTSSSEVERSNNSTPNSSSSDSEPLKVDNENRAPRTMEEMTKEAEWLRGLFREAGHEIEVD